MPIQLTTALQTGVIDPSGPYTQVKIITFTLNTIRKFIEVNCQYGNTVNNEWVPGIATGSASNQTLIIQDSGEATDYTDMITAESAAEGEVYYDKVKEILYQWLIDNEYYDGTIV